MNDQTDRRETFTLDFGDGVRTTLAIDFGKLAQRADEWQADFFAVKHRGKARPSHRQRYVEWFCSVMAQVATRANKSLVVAPLPDGRRGAVVFEPSQPPEFFALP